MTHNTSNPLVSVIIVNWNGAPYLQNCVDAIVQHLNVNFEIIVVDNNSTDRSVPFIKNRYPWIRLIEPGNNLGFAKGNNLGAKNARGEFLLLLNNDTILSSDISTAIDMLACRPDVGAVGAKMLSPDGRYRHSAGYFPRPHRLFKLSTMFRKDGPFKTGNFPKQPTNSHYNVDFVEGSFLFVRRSQWLKIGGFDPTFFMYGEDVEFCYRLRRHGLKTLFMPHIKYIHFGGFTYDREHLVTNGIVTFHQKWSGRLIRHLVWTILTARLFGRYIFYRLKNDDNGINNHKTKADASLVALRQLFNFSAGER